MCNSNVFDKSIRAMEKHLEEVKDGEFLQDYYEIETHQGPTAIEFIRLFNNQNTEGKL